LDPAKPELAARSWLQAPFWYMPNLPPPGSERSGLITNDYQEEAISRLLLGYPEPAVPIGTLGEVSHLGRCTVEILGVSRSTLCRLIASVELAAIRFDRVMNSAKS